MIIWSKNLNDPQCSWQLWARYTLMIVIWIHISNTYRAVTVFEWMSWYFQATETPIDDVVQEGDAPRRRERTYKWPKFKWHRFYHHSTITIACWCISSFYKGFMQRTPIGLFSAHVFDQNGNSEDVPSLKLMYIAPENRPPQRESSLPTTHFQVLCYF